MFTEKSSSRYVELTPELAASFSSMERWDGERPQSEERVQYHLNERAAGRFYSPTWFVAHVPGRPPIRVNGQHTSVALCRMNGDFPVGLRVWIRDFHCDTERDVADLFNTIDSKSSVRTAAQGMRAYAVTIADLERSIPPTSLYRLASGILIHYAKGAVTRTSVQTRHNVLRDEVVFANAAAPLIKHKYFKFAGACAALFASWCASLRDERRRERWDSFWANVLAKQPVQPSTAESVLSRYLRDLSIANKQSDDVRAVYSKCIHAWNAHADGRNKSLAYFANARVPSAR